VKSESKEEEQRENGTSSGNCETVSFSIVGILTSRVKSYTYLWIIG
jgi:hypothetical protein